MAPRLSLAFVNQRRQKGGGGLATPHIGKRDAAGIATACARPFGELLQVCVGDIMTVVSDPMGCGGGGGVGAGVRHSVQT